MCSAGESSLCQLCKDASHKPPFRQTAWAENLLMLGLGTAKRPVVPSLPWALPATTRTGDSDHSTCEPAPTSSYHTLPFTLALGAPGPSSPRGPRPAHPRVEQADILPLALRMYRSGPNKHPPRDQRATLLPGPQPPEPYGTCVVRLCSLVGLPHKAVMKQ